MKGSTQFENASPGSLLLQRSISACAWGRTKAQLLGSIAPQQQLSIHPDVLAAAVVARPDPKWGETPCAFVELKFGAYTTPEDIVRHCKQHLAGFKVPRYVVFGELPKTSTGKIQKFELRKRAGSASAIDV